MKIIGLFFLIIFRASMSWAADGHAVEAVVDFTSTIYGYSGALLFVLAYAVVPLENKIHLRKSKPVLLAAGLIWILVAS